MLGGRRLTDYQVSQVTVSESGSQRVEDAVVKVPNSLRILSIKSTISQKIKIGKINFTYVSRQCVSFGGKKYHFFVHFLSISSTKSIISQKLKFTKVQKLFLHRFQNITQLFGTKRILVSFE